MPRPAAARGLLRGRGSPASIRLDGRPPSVLALHGFGGTPREVELVVAVAEQLGLAARAPLLPGHGTTVAELSRFRFEDWLAAAEAAYRELAAVGEVIVVGLSLGSLLALSLAAAHPDRTLGVAALANAMWLHSPWPTWPLKLIERLRLPDFSLSKNGPRLGEADQRREHLTYDSQPIRAAISVLRAGERLSTQLASVRCPALLVHGSLDTVCPVSNAWRVSVRLGSADKRLVILPKSHHIVTRDVERATVRSELGSFFGTLLATRSQREPVDP